MSHFAQINQNGTVLRVVVADSAEWCAEHLGGMWIQTSYNTQGGEHRLGGTPMRKNYAGIGYKYDRVRDAFIPPKPSDTAVLDEVKCQWVDPVQSVPTGNVRV